MAFIYVYAVIGNYGQGLIVAQGILYGLATVNSSVCISLRYAPYAR